MAVELKTQLVGRFNPIQLPCAPYEPIWETVGAKIAESSSSVIYSVKKSNPHRIYKVILQTQLRNGDELRICDLAAKIGVAPAFHGARLIQKEAMNFIFIEMDDAGKSLIQTMIHQGYSTDGEIEAALDWPIADAPAIEAIIDDVYQKRETFFFELFSKLKILAEHRIAYKETHPGNLCISVEKGCQLIDFKSAIQMPSIEEAKQTTMASAYNQQLLTEFCNLKNRSKESQELIHWFAGNLNFSWTNSIIS